MRGLQSILSLIFCVSCLEPYAPPVTPSPLGALVVDGFVAADGTAVIKLARSIPLTSNGYTPREKGATVKIESTTGGLFDLIETDSGTYTASNVTIEGQDEYTLHVQTADGSEYISDRVQIYPTPPIDNVYFTVSSSGEELEIRVDAHDDNPDATGFYLWDGLETFEYHAPIFVGFKFVNGRPLELETDEIMYTCWRDMIKPSVMLSTNYLTENLIKSHQVAIIAKGSEKISVRYSILIKQRAISEAEYAFRTQVQNSTEQQGSLFSVIPGTVVSNVHSLTNSNEYVLGYFRAQHVQERRFFIDRSDLPPSFLVPQPSSGCQTEQTCAIVDGGPGSGRINCIPLELLGSDALITSANTDGRGVVLSYNFVTAGCGDCRMSGGTIVRPPFW